MLDRNHEVSIIVNGEEVDIYSQERLNLRINNVVFDPVTITTKTGEYSFSFELPATSKNNRIFNYANNSAKLNKFNTRYNCEVIADGKIIFNGTLRLTETKTDNYKCNLVNIKIYNIQEIFEDMVMSDLDWDVDFDGTTTINEVNNDLTTKYYFPLACYGAFQKDPKAVYNNEINQYSDLLQIDSYNKWYWESFHPSLNLLEVVKKLFAQRGYKVNGNIFNDPAMQNIYMSEYIDSSQDPTYNLNKDNIGNLHVAGSFSNSGNVNAETSYTGRTNNRGENRVVTSTFQDLTFPKEFAYDDVYNWDRISVYDVFATPSGSSFHNFTTQPTNPYIYRRNSITNSSGFVYIPATGLYTIELTVSNVSVQNATPFTYGEKYKESPRAEESVRRKQVGNNLAEMPVEIQLVRNSIETELIYKADVDTKNMYPHEMDYSKYKEVQRTTGTTSNTSNPRTNDNIIVTPVTSDNDTSGRGGRGGRVKRKGRELVLVDDIGESAITTRSQRENVPDLCYYQRGGATIAYDPYANPNFICGFTTINASPAVIKNGMSWNPSVTDFNQSHFRCDGYIERNSNGVEKQSDYNKNTLDCPNSDYFSSNGFTMNGKITCVVELNKNDIVYLLMVTRLYNEVQTGNTITEYRSYPASFNYDLKITPYTDKKDQYVNVQNLYYLPSDEVKEQGWGTKLRLGNFMNTKEKASDFISNFIKTFNLECIQDGNNVTLNKQKKNILPLNFVELDGRINTDNVLFQRIDYPKSMQVKWSIDDEEAGAYRSIPTVEQQGAANWKDYIDRGSDKVIMDTTNESTETSIESKFAYTWYQDFTYIEFDFNTLENNSHYTTLRLPIISKDEYFIVQNDESMKHDGLSLKQRLWFRNPIIQERLRMWNGEQAYITVPNDSYKGLTLNFKKQVGSLLDTYFNVVCKADHNFIEVEAYITPEEYLLLKNGAMARIDNDLYIMSEITGFDCTGYNTTTLKLIKL